jgi:protein-disulfide isomerase
MTLRGEPTMDTLARLAKDLGLEAKPILDRMNTPPVMAVIQENHALADEMEINGTPAFVLKDMVMRGYAPLETMQEFVAAARTEG